MKTQPSRACYALAFLCALFLTLTAAADPGAKRWDKTRGVLVPCEAPVEDRYLVFYEPSRLDLLPAVAQGDEKASAMAHQVLAGEPGEVTHLYTAREVPGFAVRADAATAERLNRDPRVAWVEQACPLVPSAFSSWALDRIDQATGYDQAYHFPGTGKYVHIYVVDTGIDPDDAEFGRRLLTGSNDSKSFHPTETDPLEDDWYSPNAPYVYDGHGTAVAALAAGTRYGVAKEAYLHSVRIFGDRDLPDWQASTAEFVAAMQWIRAVGKKPAVVNMSFVMDDARPDYDASAMATEIALTEQAGFVLVAAANNSGYDTCAAQEIPSSRPEVITVGATTSGDQVHPQSNFGPCVDLYAPGDNVPSLAPDGSEQNVGGTSFAAPLVSGAAALYLETQPSATPVAVKNHLVNQSTKNVLGNVQTGSHNRLLHVAPDARDSNACLAWRCDVATRQCVFNLGCSWMEGGGGSYSLTFGDGHSYTGTAPVVSHTYPNNDVYNVTLTILPTFAPNDTQSACVNTHGAGLWGCYNSSTAY